MTKLRKLTPLTDSTLLKITVNKMYDKQGFDLPNLQRKFSKFLRFNTLKNRFWIKSRYNNTTLSCIVSTSENNVSIVVTSNNSVHTYLFFVTSNKNFMQKLIKHELI